MMTGQWVRSMLGKQDENSSEGENSMPSNRKPSQKGVDLKSLTEETKNSYEKEAS